VRLIKEQSPLPRLLALPLLILMAGALIAARLFPELVFGLAHCPMRDITGVPCPTCGGTHSAVSLAAGRWTDALLANPVTLLAMGLLVIWAVYGLGATVIPRWRRSLYLSAGEKKAARIGAAVLFVMAWLWQIARVNLHWI